MEQYIEIAIITAQATYLVDTLEEMETQRKFLRKVGKTIDRIEVRCYECDEGEIWGEADCICKKVIWRV